jgi:small conductance mechanosensitive channel
LSFQVTENKQGEQTMSEWGNTIINVATHVGLKVIGAIVIWVVGRWLINLVVRLLQRALQRQHFDPTLLRYLGNVVTIALNIALAVGILGYFGVETTSFAALLAAAGIAIGAAWGGLLGNFAAGAFLIILRPYKAGDFITGGGVTGTVKEVGLFVTTIVTLENVVTFTGNAKIFSDVIQNFSANPYRRVDLVAQLNHGVDHNAAIVMLKERLAKIPNVMTEPLPDVEILTFTLAGPVLAVRPYCHTDHYWQVYFDTNRTIREALSAAGFPSPMPAQVVFVNQQQA